MSMLPAWWIQHITKHKEAQVLDKDGNLHSEPLLEPIDEERLEYIEGSSFDLVIDDLQTGDDIPNNILYIGKEKRITPKLRQVPTFDGFLVEAFNVDGDTVYSSIHRERPNRDTVEKLKIVHKADQVSYIEQKEVWELETDFFYLGTSKEKVNVPLDVAALIDPRTTIFRGGVAIYCSWAHPNYQGTLDVGIKNHRQQSAFIQKGARFTTIHFFEFTYKDNVLRTGGHINNDVPLQTTVEMINPYGCSPKCVALWQGGGKVTTNGKSERAY